MRDTDFGPVPASRLSDEATVITSALSGGRRVLVANSGAVVALVEPHVDAADSKPLDDVVELSEMTADRSRSFVAALGDGQHYGLTSSGVLVGVLRDIVGDEMSEGELTPVQLAAYESAVSGHLAANPDTTLDDFAEFTAEVAARIRTRHSGLPPAPTG